MPQPANTRHGSSWRSVALLVGWAALPFGWLLPNHYLPWGNFHGELAAALSMWFIALGLQARQGTWGLPWPAVVVAVLACVPALQWAGGMEVPGGDVWMSTFYLLGLAACISVGFSGVDRSKGSLSGDRFPMAQFCAAILCASLLSVALALCQWLRVEGLGILMADIRPGARPYANLAQANLFATLLSWGIVAALYLRHSGRFGLATTAGLVALQGFTLALTQSRTGLLQAALLLGWWWWQRRRAAPRLASWAAPLAFVLFLSVWFALPFINEWLLLSSRAALAERASAGIRPVMYRHLWDGLVTSPWLGHGWMQVPAALAAHVDPNVWSRPTQFSHNLFLDLMIWNGMPLGALLSLALVAWFVVRLRGCVSADAWAALAMLSMLMLHAQLEYPNAYGFFLWPAGLLVGIVEREAAARVVVALRPRVAALPVAALAVAIAWVTVEYVELEADFRLARFEVARVGTVKAAQAAPDVLMLTQVREHVRAMRTPPRRDMSDAELLQLDRASRRDASRGLIFRHVVALAMNGRPEAARRELARGRMLFGPQRHELMLRELRELADSDVPELRGILPPQ